jgi:hypothetical protein
MGCGKAYWVVLELWWKFEKGQGGHEPAPAKFRPIERAAYAKSVAYTLSP